MSRDWEELESRSVEGESQDSGEVKPEKEREWREQPEKERGRDAHTGRGEENEVCLT